MRETPIETNAHSELMLRMKDMLPNYDRLPVQKDDRRIGRVTEVVLRTESRVQFLNKEITRYREVMDGEENSDRRMHLMVILDELEFEFLYTFGLYMLQLHMEPELKSWGGVPLFTLRSEVEEGENIVVAVIESNVSKRYRHKAERKYSRGETMRFFRDIVLGT
jgi:hypothetical protein